MRQNENWSRPIGCVQKIFLILRPNFGKDNNKSCQKFCPFGMA
jgi:hypothetical protein